MWQKELQNCPEDDREDMASSSPKMKTSNNFLGERVKKIEYPVCFMLGVRVELIT